MENKEGCLKEKEMGKTPTATVSTEYMVKRRERDPGVKPGIESGKESGCEVMGVFENGEL